MSILYIYTLHLCVFRLCPHPVRCIQVRIEFITSKRSEFDKTSVRVKRISHLIAVISNELPYITAVNHAHITHQIQLAVTL